ncbi:MAG TPA: NAD(P)-binding domain-containing protein [Paraburkholderia sp.]|uniref:NADPH-dependent F420 reductase n=1 Tax=Paraburkholderia sp. TaxID=1926495 RepID=UPI002C4D9E13|nr:NAD(P)-binding domain-containing protein [Paraburkholderia sp.]HTR08416.1 NAD(P)-binding domain-containing protein [Paraburkholderia sp.]
MNEHRYPVGILGAGEIGSALGELLAQAGYEVMLSSRHPEARADQAAALGCRIGTLEEAAAFGEVVIAALPLNALGEIPASALAGKVVIDTMNYYPPRDGAIAAFDEYRSTTSERVARHLSGARVVKAFNAILAYDLPRDTRPPIEDGRRALPVAADDEEAKALVAGMHAQLDFDVLDAGSLADSWRFERAKPAYCIPLNRVQLRAALAAAERDKELPHGSWRRKPRLD